MRALVLVVGDCICYSAYTAFSTQHTGLAHTGPIHTRRPPEIELCYFLAGSCSHPPAQLLSPLQRHRHLYLITRPFISLAPVLQGPGPQLSAGAGALAQGCGGPYP